MSSWRHSLFLSGLLLCALVVVITTSGDSIDAPHEFCISDNSPELSVAALKPVSVAKQSIRITSLPVLVEFKLINVVKAGQSSPQFHEPSAGLAETFKLVSLTVLRI